MKRNNKGFTLVELLAALVILGVLALFALPTVINLLSDSRNKLYITDAKKLISQAEYKFRGASSEIEKPDSGECLVLSMVYLDNSDFDNAPNNGKYLREASYVVVKNNNGNYEFSAELVEEISKNVYKGVELTRDSNLKTSSTRHVVSFTKDDLNFVESNTVMGSYNGKQLDSDYINSKLGNSYIEGISKVYNYPDLADSTYNANYALPRIARAEYVSASNKNFNSLDICKLLMALCVVAMHTEPLVHCAVPIINDIYDSFVRMAVPFFFLSSGFLFAQKFETPFSSPKNIAIVKKYLLKFIKMYVVWTVIYLPIALYHYLSAGRGVLKSVFLYIKGFVFVGEQDNSWHLWYLLSTIYALVFILVLLNLKVSPKKMIIFSSIIFLISIGIDYLSACAGSSNTFIELFIKMIKGTIGSGRILTGLFYLPLGCFFAQKQPNLQVSWLMLVTY